MENESQDKQHLERLGSVYRFGCYNERKAKYCHLLGDYLEGIKKDYEKAAKIYKSTCDDYAYGRSCYKYGNYCFLGKGQSGSKGEPLIAYKYYEKGCNLKDSDACLFAALLLISRAMPKEMNKDLPKGVRYMTKSCDLDNATACFYLSGMYISGLRETNSTTQTLESDANVGAWILNKDLPKAFQLARKACDLRNMYACVNVSQMYAHGYGTEKDQTKAEKYKNLAIEIEKEIKARQALLTQMQ